MLHKHEASVEEGRVEGERVDDGITRGRNGRGMDGGREEGSGGGIARGKDGARK